MSEDKGLTIAEMLITLLILGAIIELLKRKGIK